MCNFSNLVGTDGQKPGVLCHLKKLHRKNKKKSTQYMSKEASVLVLVDI